MNTIKEVMPCIYCNDGVSVEIPIKTRWATIVAFCQGCGGTFVARSELNFTYNLHKVDGCHGTSNDD